MFLSGIVDRLDVPLEGCDPLRLVHQLAPPAQDLADETLRPAPDNPLADRALPAGLRREFHPLVNGAGDVPLGPTKHHAPRGCCQPRSVACKVSPPCEGTRHRHENPSPQNLSSDAKKIPLDRNSGTPPTPSFGNSSVLPSNENIGTEPQLRLTDFLRDTPAVERLAQPFVCQPGPNLLHQLTMPDSRMHLLAPPTQRPTLHLVRPEPHHPSPHQPLLPRFRYPLH
mmetsp:Transcript_10914/g.26473  ORF Transcript_10914/g.26473 Transcript_10914/m.26473 type:complete len:226 (-) Transcript_10914:38-715(-)